MTVSPKTYGVVPLRPGVFAHHASMDVHIEQNEYMVLSLVAPDGEVVALQQETARGDGLTTRVALMAYSRHPEVQFQAFKGVLWPAYPFRDLMEMARYLGLYRPGKDIVREEDYEPWEDDA